jgi:hypothetical protein
MSADADATEKPVKSRKLSHDLFHGLSPEEFDSEAQSLADAQAMTPQVRARLKAQLIERLMTPVDRPSWGPDWVRRGERDAPRARREGFLDRFRGSDDTRPAGGGDDDLTRVERDDANVMVRNLEKSRQVNHYRTLYALAALLAISIAMVAMFVDYQIIRGDVWTRALSNEFMVVPASLKSSVVFKSLQVIFAVLIVHFMLKITGVYGRNALVTSAFICAIVMIGCLGYLVAYNNMAGGTSTTLEHNTDGTEDKPGSSIDRLFASLDSSGRDADRAAPAADSPTAPVTGTDAPGSHVTRAGMGLDEISLHVPKISQQSLANADSWLWLAFASVIFFIVTVVAALYLLTSENNVRNFLISRDYKHRQRQFAQLHLLELADRRQNGAGA